MMRRAVEVGQVEWFEFWVLTFHRMMLRLAEVEKLEKVGLGIQSYG